jgi:hypothetical protein
MKFPITQSSPASYYFIPLESKYSPQRPFHKYLQFTFFSWCQRQSF